LLLYGFSHCVYFLLAISEEFPSSLFVVFASVLLVLLFLL